MDNSSKAIIIAGGFFIGVALISVFMYLLTTFRSFQETSNQMMDLRAKQQFNAYFSEFHEGDTVKGYQIYNLIGLAIELNSKSDAEYTVKLNGRDTISGNQGLQSLRDHFYFTEYLDEDYKIDRIVYSDGVVSNIEYSKKV